MYNKKIVKNLAKIKKKLQVQYGTFHHHNKKNPLDELIFIICSIKRSEARYLLAYKALKNEFKNYQQMSGAPLKQLTKILKPYGLQNEKASYIKSILKSTIKVFSKPTLNPLKKMNDIDCEAFLLELRGVGKKIARCVMLYSLDRNVFPVDSNCWRICHRLGLINWPHKEKTITSKDMDLLQNIIPPEIRFSLHSNLVMHGRRVCTAKKPKCSSCLIEKFCAKNNV